MKVAIVGSRSIKNEDLVINFIEECHSFDSYNDKIISGGARGVDTIAEKYAKDNNIRTVIFVPNWEKYGNRAGFIRNSDIISKCEKCIIIWDGSSELTKNDIELCEEMRKPCYIYDISKDLKYEINTEIQINQI
jgi:hypothetical protein